MKLNSNEFEFIRRCKQRGIRSAEDIRGKRVFLGPPGGGAWNAAKEWLELPGASSLIKILIPVSSLLVSESKQCKERRGSLGMIKNQGGIVRAIAG
jgi:hypothetical protein